MFRRTRPVFFVLIYLFACLNSISAAQGRRLTLKECEELALKNHQDIKGAESRLRTARVRSAQAAHARILPKFELRNVWGPIPKALGKVNEFGAVVSADTSSGITDLRYFTEFELSVVQPIYTFGKLAGLNDAAAFGLQAEEANLERRKRSVQAQVRELYWGLVLGKELLAVIEEARSEVAKAEEKLEVKLDEGSDDVSQTDMFKLKIFNYEVSKRYREALDKVQLGKSALRIILDLDEFEDFEIDSEYLESIEFSLDSLPAYYEIAAQFRPEIFHLAAGLNARQALVRTAKSDFYPQFFFAGQVKYNFAKDRFDPKNPFVHNPTNFFRPGFVIGANMNLNFWQTRDKVRLAEIEYRKLADSQPILDKAIKLEVEKTYLAVRLAESNLRESRRALRASDNWLRSTTMTFDLGVGEIKELIDAFKANGAMQTEHFQNIFRYNTAIANLSKAVGRDLYSN